MKDDILSNYWQEFKKNNPDNILSNDTLVPLSSLFGNSRNTAGLGQTVELFYPQENTNGGNSLKKKTTK